MEGSKRPCIHHHYSSPLSPPSSSLSIPRETHQGKELQGVSIEAGSLPAKALERESTTSDKNEREYLKCSSSNASKTSSKDTNRPTKEEKTLHEGLQGVLAMEVTKGEASSCEGSLLVHGDCGRERLKRHRVEVAGRVWIPDIWGQEDLLKDWIDCSAFDASLVSNKIMSARSALVEEGRRPNSAGLRIGHRC